MQERDMVVTGGLTWWEDFICVACYNLQVSFVCKIFTFWSQFVKQEEAYGSKLYGDFIIFILNFSIFIKEGFAQSSDLRAML